MMPDTHPQRGTKKGAPLTLVARLGEIGRAVACVMLVCVIASCTDDERAAPVASPTLTSPPSDSQTEVRAPAPVAEQEDAVKPEPTPSTTEEQPSAFLKAAPDSPIVRIYRKFIFSGHRGTGKEGVYRFNANIKNPETESFREKLYLVGTSLVDNELVFQGWETFEPSPYHTCDRRFDATYRGAERTSRALVSIENDRELDGRFYAVSAVEESLPTKVREQIGGETGYGLRFDADTQSACQNKPRESRYRFALGSDVIEYYAASCLAWGEASAYGAAFSTLFRLGQDGAVETLCAGEACPGLLAYEADVQFVADLDANGKPEVTLEEDGGVGIFEIGDPSTLVLPVLAWYEGESWPCYYGREDELLLEHTAPIAQ